MAGTDPSVNLEEELEHFMDEDEELAAQSISAATARRSQRRESLGPYPLREAAAPVMSAYERSMQQLKLSHKAACNREDVIAEHCKRCAQDLQRCQKIVKEASEACARTKPAVPASESKLRTAQDHTLWLDEIHSHCEKTKAKAVFEAPVMAAFCKAVDQIFETLQLQRGQAKEAEAALAQSKALHEDSCQEHSSQQRRAEQAQEASRQAELQLRAAQADVARIESEYKAAQEAVKQVGELKDAVARAEASLQEAARARDDAQAKMSQHRSWVEDMQSFFQGHKVKDAQAVCSGLQSVCRPGDPMPILMRSMLSESSSIIDRGNPTVISLRDLVREPIRKVDESLHKHLAVEQNRFLQSHQAHEKFRQQLRQLQEELQQKLAANLGADSKAPTAFLRPSKATPSAVATPLKCHEARSDLQGRISTGRNLKAPPGK